MTENYKNLPKLLKCDHIVKVSNTVKVITMLQLFLFCDMEYIHVVFNVMR